MKYWVKKINGNSDNAAYSGSRASNWNNYLWNSNWNIGCRFASEHRIFAFAYLKGYAVRSLLKNVVSFFAQRKRIHLEVCKTTSSVSETRRQQNRRANG